MTLDDIRNPRAAAVDAWADFVAEVAAVDTGLEFIDAVETIVADKTFFGAVTVDVDTEPAFAEASFHVAANALRSGDWNNVAAAIDTTWL